MLPVVLLSVRCCKPLSLLSFTVFVVLVCGVAYFLFSEGQEIFFNYSLHYYFSLVFVNRKRFQFCLRGKGGSSFASFAQCLGLCGLQMCLHLCVGYFSSSPFIKSSANILACVITVSTAFSCKSGG